MPLVLVAVFCTTVSSKCAEKLEYSPQPSAEELIDKYVRYSKEANVEAFRKLIHPEYEKLFSYEEIKDRVSGKTENKKTEDYSFQIAETTDYKISQLKKTWKMPILPTHEVMLKYDKSGRNLYLIKEKDQGWYLLLPKTKSPEQIKRNRAFTEGVTYHKDQLSNWLHQWQVYFRNPSKAPCRIYLRKDSGDKAQAESAQILVSEKTIGLAEKISFEFMVQRLSKWNDPIAVEGAAARYGFSRKLPPHPKAVSSSFAVPGNKFTSFDLNKDFDLSENQLTFIQFSVLHNGDEQKYSIVFETVPD